MKSCPIIHVMCLGGLLIAPGYSQERPPSGTTRTVLPDRVVRWDRNTTPNFVSGWWQTLYDLFGFKPSGAPPFRRSVAFLVGVGNYEKMDRLVYVPTDLTKMRNYLIEEAGFDTVYEAREGLVTRSLLESYMRNKFTRSGKLLDPEDRLLFFFSGHGGDQDGVGYLLFAKAVPGDFYGDTVLPIRDCQEWSRLNAAKHLLIVFDSCASGLAVRSKVGLNPHDALLRTMSREGSRMVLTAGTAEEKAFQVKVSNDQGYSVWTRAFLEVLRRGEADKENKGFITAEEVHAQIKTRVATFASQNQRSMTPDWDELPPPAGKDYRGTFVFLNRLAKNPRLSPQYRELLEVRDKGESTAKNPEWEAVHQAWLEFRHCDNPSRIRRLMETYKDNREFAWMMEDLRVRCLDVPTGPAFDPSTRKQNVKDGLYYVWIPPGQFRMGCSPGDWECAEDEKPPHPVTITRGFWIGQTEVTEEAYLKGTGAKHAILPGAENRPVTGVSWDAASAYCAAVGLRLPTEAEWEYAARAGSTEARYASIEAVSSFGSIVGSKAANAWGLYDMLGNVTEWTADWYDGFYYQNSPTQDPKGSATGLERVFRGGSYSDNRRFLRASARAHWAPTTQSGNQGLRCAGEFR